MHVHRFNGPRGQIHYLDHESEVLKSNPWGDPIRRRIGVYTPPGYDQEPDRRYPLLVCFAGYSGSGLLACAHSTQRENIPERFDRLLHEGKTEPAIIAFPDCFSRLDGSQYVNSSALANHADYVIKEVVPAVEAQFRCYGDRDHRGVFGKSSGGFGAMYHAMVYSDFWGGAVSHSGDTGFEYCFRHMMAKLLRFLEPYDFDVIKAVDGYWQINKPSYDQLMSMLLLGMAASYDPDPSQPHKFRLPFTDIRSGTIDEEAWQRWLRFDTSLIVDDHVEALKSLKFLYLDCGRLDEFNLLYGSRQMVKRFEKHQIPHIYQEFDDYHGYVCYRMDESLPKLVAALNG